MNDLIYFARRLAVYGGKPLIGLVAGMIVLGMFEGVGIFLLIPLLSVVGIFESSGYEGLPLMEGPIQWLREQPLPVSLGMLLCAFLLLIAGMNYSQRRLTLRNTRLIHGFGRQIRVGLYDSLLDAEWSLYVRRRKSDLMNALTAETARTMYGAGLVLTLTTAVISALIQIAIAFFLAPGLTAVVLLCGVAVGLSAFRFVREAKRLGGRTSELTRSYLAGITDQMQGMKDMKAGGMEEAGKRWHAGLTEDMVQEQLSYVKMNSASNNVFRFASAMFIALLVYISFLFFKVQSHELLLVIAIFARLWPRMTGIQSNVQQIASAVPALRSVIQLLEECREAREDVRGPSEARLALTGGIEFRDVRYRYSGQAVHALDRVSLFIHANCTTAIVGSSGAGKSTLVDCIMGLLRPESGELLLDGKSAVGDTLHSLRRSVGYVSQEPFLFNGTIGDNLRMARPGATVEEMKEALEFAAATFVMKLPHGLDTEVGDRGIRLSGGERQRLVLARAILRKPNMLILDEATSALDSENEHHIQEALDRLKGRMTIIVIAHRLSTIRNADQVVVMERGRIVQCGPYAALAGDHAGHFSRLLDLQRTVTA